ncbi:50S ribosomal protein L6 [Calditrichota bacterium]
MSRIGKIPVAIPEKVEVKLDNNFLVCKGPKGELKRQLHTEMNIKIENNEIKVERPSDAIKHRSLHGLTRTLVANMVNGVSSGFSKKMLITGVGYKAELKGKKLLLTLGYSHPILMDFPDSISVTCPSPTEIVVEGSDKELVGMVAAKIRSFRKPEPFKGKGIRYEDEYVRRKAGKTGAA